VPVLLDADLAGLYGVDTKVLNQAVKRNKDRFPLDFMFQLTTDEKAEVVANCDHLAKLKFSKSLPFAFTEHGAIQAANVLSSPEAVQMGIHVVRVFVQIRSEIFYSDFLSSRSNRNGSNT
jgi:ORF6N domain